MYKHLRSTLLIPLLSAAIFANTAPAHAADGETSIKKARCVACHAVDVKRVGPAYKDVAIKYKGDAKAPARLFDKVRVGGSGNWGEIPMLAHPADKIGDEDLKAAISWILALE